jgi:hypothetical protein
MAAAQPPDELRDSHGKPRAERGGIVRGIEPLDRDELRSQGRQRRPTFSTMGITFTVCADGRGPRPGVAARRHPSIQSERRERLADHALHGVAPQLEQDRLQTQALHQPVPRRPSGGVPDNAGSVSHYQVSRHGCCCIPQVSCRLSRVVVLPNLALRGQGHRLRRRHRPALRAAPPAPSSAGRPLIQLNATPATTTASPRANTTQPHRARRRIHQTRRGRGGGGARGAGRQRSPGRGP